jgi:hypothetical protein
MTGHWNLKSEATVNATETVMLKGGFVVSVEAIRLCLDLEARGCTSELDGVDGFAIGPKYLLTDDDRQQLRLHRDAVAAVLRYCETVQ